MALPSTINTSLKDERRQVITIKINKNFVSLRGLREKRTRFEIEYSLEKGSTINSFLFLSGQESEQKEAILIHPPGIAFATSFLDSLKEIIPKETKKLSIIVGHINPNRIKLIKEVYNHYSNLEIISSNPCAKLFNELWEQKNPSNINHDLSQSFKEKPKIKIIRQEETLKIGNNYRIKLIPIPTARWPGGLIAFEESEGLLMSEKIFGAHVCTEEWAETNRVSTQELRRHYFECLMAPMTSQIDSLIDKLEELDIRTIAPSHGPAIEISWRSLLNDYRQWGEGKEQSLTKVILLFASAYGNTATIADALANGINKAGVRIESFNCEFTSPKELTQAIKGADAYLIGSPTLGGHAPTPIVAALGILLTEGNRKNPVGIFGSYGWSGEALDLLEKKLKDGGFLFGFDPIKIKFTPDSKTLKTLEEIGTVFGRKLLKRKKKDPRRITKDISSSRNDPALLALGRIIGSLCVLTTQKGEGEDSLSGAMVASWVSQASFSPPGLSIAVAKDRAVENLLHTGDFFALNVLCAGKEKIPMRQFLKPFAPGENRLSGLNLDISPNKQPLLKEGLAWLDCCVKARMECGDHWLIYAEVSHGKVLDKNGVTAIHHRRSGASY